MARENPLSSISCGIDVEKLRSQGLEFCMSDPIGLGGNRH